MSEKFSYSKLSTFTECGWKYKLIYVDEHFIQSNNVATDFGTLIHHVEECMARDIQANNNEPNFLMDYDKYIDMFININDENNKVFGVNKLREMYPDDFYKEDKNNLTYAQKASIYANDAIYRLRDYMTDNPNLEIIGIEQDFTLQYKDYTLKGCIDRVFRDKIKRNIIIEDIKTYSNPVDSKNLTTPLQFVIYTLAARELYGYLYENVDINCVYDLPLCQCKQNAGTKGYLKRGTDKLDKILGGIEDKIFEPKPSALCYWCNFSKTNPRQPEEAQNLCPYYSRWTRENKDYNVDFEWMGVENHEAIMEAFTKGDRKTEPLLKPRAVITDESTRRFLIRR